MIIRALHYNECQAYGLRLQDVDEGRPENKFVSYILDSIWHGEFCAKIKLPTNIEQQVVHHND